MPHFSRKLQTCLFLFFISLHITKVWIIFRISLITHKDYHLQPKTSLHSKIMAMPTCKICEQPLRSGEENICQPCFDRRLRSLNLPAVNPVVPSRGEVKTAAARAAATAYVNRNGPQSTGFHMDQLYNSKTDRLNSRKEASGRRMVGTPARAKPAPFTSSPSTATSSVRRACSVGWMVQFEREHHSLTILQGIVHVNRTGPTILQDTKMAIFELWPRDKPEPNHWSASLPSPPSVYIDRWFALARTGSSKKPPTLLHNAEVLELHLAGKGEPNLELIFLADQYFKDNPTVPRPGPSLRASLASGSGPSKLKRKADKGLSTSEKGLDESLSSLEIDVLMRKCKKKKTSKDQTPRPNSTSTCSRQPKHLEDPPNAQGMLLHEPMMAPSTSLAMLPTRRSPLQNSVPLTMALPAQQTRKSTMY